jgi:hypothetical protein
VDDPRFLAGRSALGLMRPGRWIQVIDVMMQYCPDNQSVYYQFDGRKYSQRGLRGLFAPTKLNPFLKFPFNNNSLSPDKGFKGFKGFII